MATVKAALTPRALAGRILIVRGQRVLIDSDLAALYEVETRALNQAVKRNATRFPADFMFQLTAEEVANLKSQSVISSWGGRRKLPLGFTEHGAVMAASVLNSDRAVEMSVYVVRAFVELRDLLSSHKVLAQKTGSAGAPRCTSRQLAGPDHRRHSRLDGAAPAAETSDRLYR